MKKIINNDVIEFYDDNNLIIKIGFISDELVLQVLSDSIININAESELYGCLNDIFNQNYDFGENYLGDVKNEKKLIWHSDCYFNPEYDYSIKRISCLNIIFEEKIFKVWCNNPINELFNKKNNYFCICFSPNGNGRYARNIESNMSLQDDFVFKIYNKLKEKTNVKKLVK